MSMNLLPCISIQEDAIARAAQAFHPLPEPDECGRTEMASAHHLGDDDPDMHRMWRLKGDLATVTFFDQGNGWSSIEKVETETPEDNDKFTEALWDQVLNQSSNHQHHRNMLAAAEPHCTQSLNCECASRLAATQSKGA